jgi:hypothetical protein
VISADYSDVCRVQSTFYLYLKLSLGSEMSAIGSALVGGLNGAWSSLAGSALLGELVTSPLGWIVLGHEGNSNKA